MLEPKRFKFRKEHKPRVGEKKKEQKVIGTHFGAYGLISLESGRVTNKQLEAARRVINKHLKKRGDIWISVFPDKPVTSKPAEVRMGKGKGNFDYWVSLVPKGRLIFEIKSKVLGINEIKRVLGLAGERLPLRTRLVENKI